MTTESEKSPPSNAPESQAVPNKAPWRTPRLVVQGTIKVKTLAQLSPVQPSA